MINLDCAHRFYCGQSVSWNLVWIINLTRWNILLYQGIIRQFRGISRFCINLIQSLMYLFKVIGVNILIFN